MATLPADRTKLALAQSNQNPLNVLGSSQNKNALTEAYDTIDALYNYATGLVSASTLSRLGVINVLDYNASGLATTATGSITTGTKVLTLATTPDFVAGQGINLQGAIEVASLQVTAAATSSANCTVTLNGSAFTVVLTSGNTAIQCATAIRAATYAGWTTGGTAGTDTVTFTSTTSGTKTDATYSAGTTGATGTMTTTTQGTADQISTVSSVSGLVVNIADNATRTITAGTILHDDAMAIQTAINAAVTNLTYRVYAPAGTYFLSASLTIPSNVIFEGAGEFEAILKINAASVDCFVGTTVTGVEIRNLTIDGNSQKGAVGVRFNGVQNFILENLYIHDLGIANVPVTSDSGFGGFGLQLDGRTQALQNGLIRNVKVERVVGGGTNAGDGIYIAAYNNNMAIMTNNITVEDCWVSTCGRDCYSVCGGAGQSVPQYITFKNCYAEKSSTSGLDIETGNYITVDNCIFSHCGNDQTYYNPASVYGAGYRLLAGIAVTTSMNDIMITKNKFNTCYCDVNTNLTPKVFIIANDSINCVTDSLHLYQGNGIQNSIVRDNIIDACGQIAINCYSPVNLNIEGNIIINPVGIGIKILGGNANKKNVKIKGNTVTGSLSYGLYLQQACGIIVKGNTFRNNTVGIQITSDGGIAVVDLIIQGNLCYDDQGVKTQTYPIIYTTSTGSQNWLLVTGNNFRNNINAKPAIVGANSIDANNMG